MHSFLSYLNLSSKIIIYVAFAVILDKLNRSLKQMKVMSLTDFSTGAANTRAFMSMLENEIERAARYGHPVTMMFMDMDNFKEVNDSFGHSAGNELLRLTVMTIKENVRSTDVVARMGGDEFAVLMPETDFESAKMAVEKIHSHLMGLSDKLRRGTTFSIGMVTYSKAPSSSDEVVKAADGLMYEVKNSGKNAVKYKRVE
jgi:diguanylate cyclase (GGDEF)-like protein